MKVFEVVCTDLSRVEFQAEDARAATYVGFRVARWADKVAFSVVPKGCTGLSPTAHAGRFCPIHDA